MNDILVGAVIGAAAGIITAAGGVGVLLWSQGWSIKRQRRMDTIAEWQSVAEMHRTGHQECEEKIDTVSRQNEELRQDIVWMTAHLKARGIEIPVRPPTFNLTGSGLHPSLSPPPVHDDY